MTFRFPSPVLAVGLVAGLAGCSDLGNPMTAFSRPPPPDEFRVLARKPLQLPPSATLPVPQPGVTSPLEPDPQAEAVAALLGPGSAPVATAAATAAATTVPTPGEQLLLDAANASASDPNIRADLVTDQAEREANEPYVAPTIFEVLGGDETADLSEAVDPDAEARRLREAGVAPAPVNPDEVPPSLQDQPNRSGTFSYEF